jgi:Tol biopolymer transport system component/C-terminal processing protease CtpA/Prc
MLGQTGSVTPKIYFSDPAVSPDHSEIAFVSGGDIWTVPSTGGEAHLLISNPAYESRPLYSPDGKKLAFVSTRTGGGDIYVLTFATGEVQRLTYDDGLEQLDGWSRDGKWIYFSSTSHNIGAMNDVYRVSAAGGTPMEVVADVYANEFFSSLSPDGSTLAITARSNVSGQWWRNGHSHLDESEVWLVHDAPQPRYEAITNGGAKELWPMWSADGKTLYYVSDRTGAQNIWSKGVGGGSPKPVTSFRAGRVLWPSISNDGKLIAFEHDFEIWTLDPSTGKAGRLNITRAGAPAAPGVEHLTMTDGVTELSLSPDGKKVAYVSRGEVFAGNAKTDGDAARITNTPGREYNLVWSPDSRKLVYSSDRDAAGHLYMYDFSKSQETRITSGNDTDHSARFSPDGKTLAFVRGDNEIHLLDLAANNDRMLVGGVFGRPPFGGFPPFVWSPDNRWVAYLSTGQKGFRNVSVIRTDGTNEHPITFLANSGAGSISWSPDGKMIYFETNQRTETGQIATVDLVPRTPVFREDQFRDLFKEEPARPAAAQNPAPVADADAGSSKPASKNVEIVFDDIRLRTRILQTGLDAGSLRISPDGKTLLLIAIAAGQQNLYTFPIDELARDRVARQVTSTAGGKSSAQFSPDGKEVYYLEQGRIMIATLDNRQTRRLTVTGEMDVDFAREKMEVFNQAWSYLRDTYQDPEFNGVDWQGVHRQYAPLIAGAATREEMRRLLSLMVGELNSSHSGINGPGAQSAIGKLGLRFDRKEYEQSGKLRVTTLIPLGPSMISGIKPGEYLLAVDGTTITAETNLDQILEHKINRRIEIAVAEDAAGAGRRIVALRPVDQATEKSLTYHKWVEDNRKYVAKASGGRLGYVHMYDMSDTALNQLYLDLDSENQARDGVVVDVRNNTGGFVNEYALDVFTRRNYLTMTPRNGPPAPGRSQLGQRALGLPTILLTNQHSLSDAEDFTEGYRTLKLGKVVGEPTAGWIIYTSNVGLIDGTVVRLPSTRIQGSDGKVMEMNPRPVDIPVKRPIGESYTGRDSQLDAAVGELLREIGPKEKK